MGAIPIFVAVVESKSFSGAARKLGVSKSAISKRISQLEDRLGTQLLHRSTRKLSLTEAGERYFVHASDALTAAQKAEDAALELQVTPKGRLKINVPMSFGRLHVAPVIADFLRLYPEIEIDMIMDDRVIDLIDGGYDIAIRAGTLSDSSLIARKLAPCHNVLCAAPAYLDTCGHPNAPSDLIDHNCLHYAYFSGSHEWIFYSSNEPVKVQTNGSYQVNNSEALLEATIDGLGIARFPTFIAGPHMASGKLTRLLPNYSLPEQSIYAVFPERQHLPLKVRVFIEYLG
ncbi:MAG: LysR family transcriptional regulator, partial [Pseudomonas marincola]